jgi:cephalosporin hydroxylase
MSRTDYMGRILNDHDMYVDLQGNPITGCCSYEGISVQQHTDIFTVFPDFLSKVQPKRILEIGTAAGGFTLFLRHTLDKIGLNQTFIKTFEIHPSATHESLKAFPETIDLVYDNLFNKSYNELIKPESVKDFIQQDGTTLVICDGGNKVTEFNTLSPFLKSGDYIMAHDYSASRDYFNDHIINRIWDWLEIMDSDIQQSCDAYELQPFMQQELQSVVWVCRRKA